MRTVFWPRKSMISVFMLLLFITTRAYSQAIPVKRSHPINMASLNQTVPTTGTLKVLGVMVEFKADTNRFTTGDGTFNRANLSYLQSDSITIDPLPHDRAYFEAHLKFAKNYYEKVSGGKLTVDYRLLPKIYKLDNPMADYSPTGEHFTNEKLARFIRDVWNKVDEEGGFDASGLDPENTAFVIFHAGVGRDIELTGTNLTITPQDLPSLYLDQEHIGKLLNQPDFNGFPVNNGSFHVTNSLIIPQTLSRPGEVLGNRIVLQLSINGLLTASLGSHLGLPDLFNTVTGNSGIGRFGLMDGAGFFSYSGLFPPEPSAWEKIYLGWERPFPIILDQQPINLPAVSNHQPKSIGKYAISSDEYYLVENRHRDPDNDGATLTIQTPDGHTTTQHFKNTNETFTYQEGNFDSLFTPGVVTDVDNFDFSLPGGLDRGPDGKKNTNDDRLLNGGILIWHIDHGVIESQIAEQRVNANPMRRGVDLEEADGAQDIGRSLGSTFSGIDDRGSAFDFWWKGNNASVITQAADTLTLYQNRFGPDTHPNNNSNSGAPSFFEFYDFSGNQPVATFKAKRIQSGNIQSVELATDRLAGAHTYTSGSDDYYSNYPLSMSLYKTNQDSFLVVPAQDTVYSILLNDHPGADSVHHFVIKRPTQPYTGEKLILGNDPESSDADQRISAWSFANDKWQQSWSIDATAAGKGFLSSNTDDTLFVDFTGQRLLTSTGNMLASLPGARQQSNRIGSSYSYIENNQVTLKSNGTTFSRAIAHHSDRLYTGSIELKNGKTAFYLLTDQGLFILDPTADQPMRKLIESSDFEWPAMVDYDNNGSVDFLYVDHETNQLKGLNLNGASLNNFPIDAPKGEKFTGTPLVADLNGTGHPDLLIPTQDSISLNIYGFSNDSKKLPSFPLYIGGVSEMNNQPVHPIFDQKILYAVSHRGDLKVWKFPDAKSVQWGSRYGAHPFNKVSGHLPGNNNPETISAILNREETYNWPNPASDATHIRYQTKSSGTVRVKIVNMSGSLIFDKTFDTRGGLPEEQRVSTQSWGSGVYYAVVTAHINGKSESKLIKIAVVH